MAHHLAPQPAHAPLTIAEILVRLRDEFEYVECSGRRGAEQVDNMIAAFLRIKEGGAISVSDQMIDTFRHRRSSAIWVHVADDQFAENAFFETVLIENEPLFIGYCSRQHQEEAAALVLRCAAVLGYEAHLL
jgi:hypothetical protein